MVNLEPDALTYADESGVRRLAERWICTLLARLRAEDVAGLAALFSPNATWRDLLTRTWDFTNVDGRHAIAERLVQGRSGVRDVSVTANMPPRVEATSGAMFAFYSADLELGTAVWLVQLAVGDDGAPVAQALLTQLEALTALPWRTNRARPSGREHREVASRGYGRDVRAAEQQVADGDPAVVVVGAGHCGLSIAARLKALGVPTVVIERLDRVGDNWRNRYPSLMLHDPVDVDHLPYLPFPSTWPRFTPKDKFADFLEYYSAALELNVWTGAPITRAVTVDPQTDRPQGWQLEVRRADDSSRILRPAHLVLATGWMGDPLLPHLDGMDGFAGTVLHSSRFGGGAAWRDKKAVVVGTGNSGHDIAQDLYEHGAAEVTLVQRSPTYVVTSPTFHQLWWGRWDSGEHTVEEADSLAALHNLAWSLERQEPLVRRAAELDAELLVGLNQVGFRTDLGYRNMGTAGSSTFKRTSNFHQDIGAAQLIVDGKIKVHSGAALAGLSATAALLSDGTALEADLVVLATGYGSISEAAAQLIGDLAVACEGVYGLGEDGERRIVWRRSPVDGLWFMTGNIQSARFYSKLLALQIAAIQVGLMPYRADAGAPAS